MLLLRGDAPKDALPSEELIGAMLRYNEELVKAGVLIAAEGFHGTSAATRVVHSGGKRTRVDGPFAGSNEQVAGFFMIDVESKEAAIEWAKRCPVEHGAQPGLDSIVEVRQVVQTQAELPAMTGAQRNIDRRLRAQLLVG
jgi:hypothetical protein